MYNRLMTGCVLFIDGENFLHKISEVLKGEGRDVSSINLNRLFKDALQEFKMSKKVFYAAKLHVHPDTKKKSEELVRAQRKLRNSLVRQGYEFVIAGNVRAQKMGEKVVFREKGVDVKIAIDLVSMAFEKKLDTAILCSSDSDLQPAVRELRQRGVTVVYLGFENDPNKGLSFTTDKTILLRNHEILEACPV